MPAVDEDWKQWVEQFNAPAANAVVAPGVGLPVGPGTDILSGANRANIAQLFSPQFGRDEQIRAGAEAALAGGWGQGGFAQNQTNRLLDSERKANFVLGAQLLEPYLQRDFQGAEGAADRASRLNQIAAEGAQALQRLQLSEAGTTSRLNTETASALQRAVLAGQQAMQQITLREAGETGRQRSQIQGSLAETLLRGALARSTAGADTGAAGPAGTRGYVPPGYQSTNFAGASPGASSLAGFVMNNRVFGSGGPASASIRPPYTGSLGLGSSSIDALLRKYGLL